MSEFSSANLIAVDHDPFADGALARVVPTTEAQREVWLACQMGTQASLAFNEAIAITLTGRLDETALQNALSTLVGRHEALRASIAEDGQSMLIDSGGHLSAAIIDLSIRSADDAAEDLDLLCAQSVQVPFDLQRGPLLRAQLVRLSEAQHELVISAHHIVVDGWSIGIVVRELMAVYASLAGSGRTDLAPVDSFGEYALAQAQLAGGEQAQADERFWVAQFDRPFAPLDLPADRVRATQRTFSSRRIDLPIHAARSDAWRGAAGKVGISFFAVMWGMYAALLARLGGTESVVVGMPSAGQAADDRPNMIGHCLNLLPVRLDVPFAARADVYLASVQTAVLDAQDHRTCTLGTLLRKLKVERDPGRIPLTPVQFNLDAHIPTRDLQAPGLSVSLRSIARSFENFELFVNATQTDDGLVLEAQYNTGLFDALTVTLWLEAYAASLDRFAGTPHAHVADLLQAGEHDQRLIAQFNATGMPFESGERIEQCIALHARLRPYALACSDATQSLTYAQLDALANGVAQSLREAGVEPGQLVGLTGDRKPQLVAGLIGILKAGAGYVPLDPALPVDRLTYMTGDAQISALVSDRAHRDRLSAHSGPTVLIDDVLPQVDFAAGDGMSSDSVAYVIYTSGSTGKPKGVRISHRSTMNVVASLHVEPGYAPTDRCLAHSTIAFDASILEIIPGLCAGAEIVIATRVQAVDGQAMARLLDERQITLAFATPASWRLILEAGWTPRPGLRLTTGAETLPRDLAEQLMAHGARLWNLYGPTEATILCARWEVSLDAVRRSGVSIGRPIANTSLHIRDEDGRDLPLGAPGELCVAGAAVGMGYLNHPEFDNGRFVSDPRVAGGRVYKTGDLARWRTDGTIVYLGRADQQVKIRGYRIELGEIEANLASHPEVERCVVIAKADQQGDPRLIAYVVPRQGLSDLQHLRNHLSAVLPDYMVPHQFQRIDTVPLMPSGKVDTRALPAPEFAHAGLRLRTAPRNDMERRVLSAMEAVLNLPGLGIEDDFFSLGGHSLLAARLAGRLNREFNIAMPLAGVFQAPSAAQLAVAVERSMANQGRTPARPPLTSSPGERSAPLTVMQERIRFIEELLPGTVVHSGPSAHRLRGPFDLALFSQALQTIVDRQAALRTVLERDQQGVGYVQTVQANVRIELPLIDLTGIDESNRNIALMAQMQVVIDTPIPLDRAPLFRALVYRLGDADHVFLFIAHHFAWDGWSFDLLYDEMAAVYGALVQGRDHGLQPLAVSHTDFARWHAKWMASEECAAQIAFWRGRYKQLAPGFLPRTDKPRSGRMTGTGATLWVRIPKDQTESLRALARSGDATLNMLCMTVFGLVMSTAFGQRQVVLGVPVRGRLEAELEPIMGFFNNLVPVHLRVDEATSFIESLRDFKATLLEVFSHADVPFERLAQEPEIAAHTQRTGLYQALFSFQDARERRRDWGPLQHENILVKQRAATQDLGLWLMEGPGGIEGGLMFNADLYDVSTAEVLRSALLRLLDRLAASPQTSMVELNACVDARLVGLLAPPVLGAATPRSTSLATTALSPSESVLAEIWGRLLGIETAQIRPSDNFFDLGGNSLLVRQAVTATKHQLGLEVEPQRYVFEPLAQLAAGAATSASAHDGLALVWAALLGIDAAQIGPGDNFFDLGGNSLLVMQAVARAERDFGMRIDPQRYLHENLQQLSVGVPHAADHRSVAANAPSDQLVETPTGLLSRVLGRFGRRS